MRVPTMFAVICASTLAIAGAAIAGDDDTRSRRTPSATVAIPCIPDGLRFSCSNPSPRRSLKVVDAKCIIGAGDDPEVQAVFDFRTEVGPERTEVAVVSCPDVPVPAFCTAHVFPRSSARCALTSPTGGLNAELK